MEYCLVLGGDMVVVSDNYNDFEELQLWIFCGVQYLKVEEIYLYYFEVFVVEECRWINNFELIYYFVWFGCQYSREVYIVVVVLLILFVVSLEYCENDCLICCFYWVLEYDQREGILEVGESWIESFEYDEFLLVCYV